MPPELMSQAPEDGGGAADEGLPDYAPMLAAFHRAHAQELRAMVGDLPLGPGDHALDLACGDGTYALWLAERVGPSGRVVAVDSSPAYLELAARAVAASPFGGRVELQRGDAYGLPFADGSFDLAWCAQSMFSLPDPAGALRELRRVTRPGGAVAVFENDLIHQMVLPWPPELELAIRAAQLAAIAADAEAPSAVGRDLCALFAEAGLQECRVTPYSTVRQAPLEPDEQRYLQWHLADLREQAGPHLAATDRELLDALLEPASERSLLRRPDFTVTYLDLLAVGVRTG
jgi:SAM-dependent methyltransferase